MNTQDKQTGIQRKRLPVLAQAGLLLVVAAVVASVADLLRKEPLLFRGLGAVKNSELAEGGTPKEIDGFTVLTFSEVRALVKTNAAAVFVDAQASLFYEDGHLPGAINLPFAEFDEKFPTIKARLLAAQQVVVYCHDSQCGESKRVAARLRDAGVKNIFIFSGGWLEWARRAK